MEYVECKFNDMEEDTDVKVRICMHVIPRKGQFQISQVCDSSEWGDRRQHQSSH